MKYTVLLPTYNERENIAILIWLIRRVFESIEKDYEIIVIDDNSPDGTADLVETMHKVISKDKLVVLRRPGKLGLGTAYAHGLMHCRGDFVFFMDADFSHNPKYIPDFIKKQEETGCDIVSSTRYKAGGGVSGWNFKRKLTSRGANILAATLLQPGKVSDLTGAYRLYRKSCLDKIMPQVTSKGYAFQMEIIVRSHHTGYKIEEVPIIFVDRLFGTSKLGGAEVWMYIKGLARLFFTL